MHMKKQTYSEAIPARISTPISLTTLVQAAMIAAIYVVLTFIANAFGLANYAVQVGFLTLVNRIIWQKPHNCGFFYVKFIKF